MKTPYELAYRYVIPYIQRRLVQALRARGLSNTEIAKKLGITPSAVTRYLKGERGTGIDLSMYADVEEAIEKIADAVIRRGLDKYGVMTAATAVTAYVLSRKYLCAYHAQIDEGVDPSKCSVCTQVFSSSADLLRTLT